MSSSSLGVALILLVGDLLEPFDHLPVERLLDRDGRHRRARCSTVPVLLIRPHGDDVAWPNLFDRPAPPLVTTAPKGDDQRLSERVRVQVAPRAWLERHVRGTDGRLGRSIRERLLPHRARRRRIWRDRDALRPTASIPV